MKRFWKNKRVLITGHSGFKGTWLSIWMKILGAEVTGISLPPLNKRNIFTIIDLKKKIDKNVFLNIKDKKKLEKVIIKSKPHIIFHLAAQPLVIESFKDPINTIETNIVGTANILEISKNIPSLKTILVITTDKVYSNQNKKNFFKESDRLGGDDIYSFSKVSVEMLVRSYRKLFFKNKKNVFTLRAGNVIGGGDWSENRLIPDFIRSYEKNKKFIIRNSKHVRPWQHVIDCLFGYILTAEKTYQKKIKGINTLNFGPSNINISTVKNVADIMLKKYNLKTKKISNNKNSKFLEKKFLGLNSSLAKKLLGWSPKIDLNNSIDLTLSWYEKFFQKKNMYEYTCNQIKNYIAEVK